jgi:hypothetical protein
MTKNRAQAEFIETADKHSVRTAALNVFQLKIMILSIPESGCDFE